MGEQELDLRPIEERLNNSKAAKSKITQIVADDPYNVVCFSTGQPDEQYEYPIDFGNENNTLDDADQEFFINASLDITALINEVKQLRDKLLKSQKAYVSLQMYMATGEDDNEK